MLLQRLSTDPEALSMARQLRWPLMVGATSALKPGSAGLRAGRKGAPLASSPSSAAAQPASTGSLSTAAARAKQAWRAKAPQAPAGSLPAQPDCRVRQRRAKYGQRERRARALIRDRLCFLVTRQKLRTEGCAVAAAAKEARAAERAARIRIFKAKVEQMRRLLEKLEERRAGRAEGMVGGNG